jgi:hypothetical protein
MNDREIVQFDPQCGQVDLGVEQGRLRLLEPPDKVGDLRIHPHRGGGELLHATSSVS